MLFLRSRPPFLRSPDGEGAGGGDDAAAAAAAAAAAPPAADAAAAADPFAGFTPEHKALIETKGWNKDAKGLNDVLGRALEGYVGLEGKLGRKGVLLPGKDAKPADLDAFYGALGRPEKPEDYVFSVPEGVEASETDVAFHKHMAPILHKAGLRQDQLNLLAEGFNAFSAKVAGDGEQATADQMVTATATLKADPEFGPKYNENLELANHAVRALGGEPLVAELAASGFGRFPSVVKAFWKMGQAIVEPDLISGLVGDFGPMTKADAAVEIKKMKADKEFIKKFLDNKHPEHKEAYDKMLRLQQLAGEVPNG